MSVEEFREVLTEYGHRLGENSNQLRGAVVDEEQAGQKLAGIQEKIGSAAIAASAAMNALRQAAEHLSELDKAIGEIATDYTTAEESTTRGAWASEAAADNNDTATAGIIHMTENSNNPLLQALAANAHALRNRDDVTAAKQADRAVSNGLENLGGVSEDVEQLQGRVETTIIRGGILASWLNGMMDDAISAQQAVANAGEVHEEARDATAQLSGDTFDAARSV